MHKQVIVAPIPGTDLLPGQRIIVTEALGPVVARPLTPAEIDAVLRHRHHLQPDRPGRSRPHPTPLRLVR